MYKRTGSMPSWRPPAGRVPATHTSSHACTAAGAPPSDPRRLALPLWRHAAQGPQQQGAAAIAAHAPAAGSLACLCCLAAVRLLRRITLAAVGMHHAPPTPATVRTTATRRKLPSLSPASPSRPLALRPVPGLAPFTPSLCRPSTHAHDMHPHCLPTRPFSPTQCTRGEHDCRARPAAARVHTRARLPSRQRKLPKQRRFLRHGPGA